jgi:hypothetical protein
MHTVIWAAPPAEQELPGTPQRYKQRSKGDLDFGPTQLPHHGMTMSEQDKAELRLSLARLKQDHADFDAAIDAMLKTGCDPLQIQRMKKKKLTIKDQLKRLEDQIIPDIIA